MAERHIGRPWTEYEDQLLTQAVAVHGENDNWKQIAVSIPGRSNKACRKRWLHSLSPAVKKSVWTREEDELLLSLYATHSTRWSVIARNIPGRTDDACSKRYREALDPSLKKGDWTADEDLHLLEAYRRLGGKWGQIGTELSRSGLGCRNRWRLLDRKRVFLVHKSFSVSYGPNPCDPPRHVAPWSDVPTLISTDLWDQNSLRSHPSSPRDVEMNLTGSSTPPPFQFSSSSLSTALSNTGLPSTSRDIHRSDPSLLITTHCNAEQRCSQMHLPGSNLTPDSPIRITDDDQLPSLTDSFSSREDNTPYVTNENILHPVLPASISTPPSHPDIADIPPGAAAEPPLDIPEGRLAPAAEGSKSVRSKKRSKHPSNPRLSSWLPVNADRTLFAYVCGHESCWPPNSSYGSVRFTTSKELWDHSKNDHAEAMGGNKPFRCGLDGCGKGWKSINGLQYHLQVSKTHFRQALLTQYPHTGNDQQVSNTESTLDNAGGDRKRKKYSCPHDGCPNEYRQKSGLRYHMSHGHPAVTPIQLQCVPPALVEKMSKLAES